MIHNIFDVSVSGSIGMSTLTTYIINESNELATNLRPMIIICPGGGYNIVSERESELIALQFLAAGFHAAVLRYSVSPANFPTQIKELGKSVLLIREHAKEWNVISDKIIIQGSSAGGHLAASYGCFWKKEFMSEIMKDDIEQLRPNGLILSYPVITSGEYAHRDSFCKLLGEQYNELVDQMSLENQVNADMPKTFLWHTFEDDVVPVENSLLFMYSLKKYNIPFECHIYPKGGHGLSLGNALTLGVAKTELQNEVTTWIDLAITFVSNL